MGWYAATTKPNGERTAYNRLCQKNVTAWYPRHRTHELRQRRNGHSKPQRVWIERPAYPRYLFICAPASQLWLARHCKISPVRFGEYPEPIPDPIMQVLMAGSDDTGLLATKAEVTRARYHALQSVRFTDGVLKSQLAKVINDDGDETILVLLKMLGSERAMRVRADHLEAA